MILYKPDLLTSIEIYTNLAETIEIMKTKDLRKGFYMYGNKGCVWSNSAHIAKSDLSGLTLCGTPMLASNWAKLSKMEEINCPECLSKYKELT